MLKKAMIMAAGVGSRLGALSSVVPKPLVPVANEPAILVLAKHLASFGIKNIICNTYYKAEMIQEFFKKNNCGINFEFIQETELSGTAGGVKKCSFFFDENEDFIVMSGDGLTDINIQKAYESHKKSGAMLTIVLKEVEAEEIHKYGIVVPDENGLVESFQEKPSIEEAKSNLANTGIYIFNYKIFEYIPENTFYDFAKNVFPSLMQNSIKINTYKMEGYWSDIGSLDQYKKSNEDVLLGRVSSYLPNVEKTDDGVFLNGENFVLNENSKLVGTNVIGDNCQIGKNCKIINSILWNNVEVEDNVVIENSIVLSDTFVKENCFNDILESNKIKAIL